MVGGSFDDSRDMRSHWFIYTSASESTFRPLQALGTHEYSPRVSNIAVVERSWRRSWCQEGNLLAMLTRFMYDTLRPS
jgi:hypothetical protein